MLKLVGIACVTAAAGEQQADDDDPGDREQGRLFLPPRFAEDLTGDRDENPDAGDS